MAAAARAAPTPARDRTSSISASSWCFGAARRGDVERARRRPGAAIVERKIGDAGDDEQRPAGCAGDPRRSTRRVSRAARARGAARARLRLTRTAGTRAWLAGQVPPLDHRPHRADAAGPRR